MRYRVELIVLRHLDATAAPRTEPALRDFSSAVDLVPRESADGGTQEDVAPAPGDAAIAGLPQQPPPLLWIESPGDTMQEAWRRLRQSANFRPELYFSWEQADADPFPQVRVHDDQLVYEQHASAGHSTALSSQPAPSDIDALVEPLRYYHIDGTARLRRSRFLHLELDLEWREAVGGSEPALAASPGGSLGAAPGGAAPPAQAVNLHRIRQSRTVRTDQVEYFDGPYIGVLALVTRIGPAEELPETVTEQP